MVQDNCSEPLPYMIPCPSDGAEVIEDPPILDPYRFTNADYIRSMSDNDLARFLCHLNHECYECPADELCGSGENGMLIWLKQEVKDEV